MVDPIMSGNIPISYQSAPAFAEFGQYNPDNNPGTWRSFGAEFFNKANIEKENWLRTEQSANNALYRDIVAMQYANQFNAEEAQKQRDFEERLANTSYQRAVADMKKAGINPIMLMGNGGADVPQGASASSSSRSSSGSSYRHSPGQESSVVNGLIGGIFQVVAGLITKNTKMAVAGLANATKNLDTTEIVTDSKGRTRYTKTKYYH